MRRILLAALIAAAAPVAAAPVPAPWEMRDLSSAPTRIYGVEVARFPSEMLARGVSNALQEEGWAPLGRQQNEDGSISVLLGQTDSIGEAWFIQRELASRNLVHGQIVRIKDADKSVPLDGPLASAFAPGADKTADEKTADLNQALAALDSMKVQLIAGEEDIRLMRDQIAAGDVRHPAVAKGAVTAATLLWKQRLNPEVVKFLAGRVASGEWPAAANEQNLRYRAEDLYFDVVYGQEKDWLAAWRAARRIDAASPAVPARGAASKLRQAALMVGLIEADNDPVPAFGAIRALLRETYQQAPNDAGRLLARADYLYLETFAWEGDWARVEVLARGFRSRHNDEPGYAAMADILLARSLERKSQFQTAIELLDDVAKAEVPLDKRLRDGTTIIDPGAQARDWRRHFEQMIEEKKNAASELAYQTATSPANAPEPAPLPTPPPVQTETSYNATP